MKIKRFLGFLLIFALIFAVNLDAAYAKKKRGKKQSSLATLQPVKDKNYKYNNKALQIKSIVKLFKETNPRLSNRDAESYANYVIEACDKFNQDPFAIAALIVHESTVNTKAVSKGGDYGLMQVRWKYHKDHIRRSYPAINHAKDMLTHPRENILIGTEIFAGYRGNKDISAGVRGYSSGNSKLVNKVHNTISKLQSYYKKF
ncbi:MAG: transglycosylase SLT domain-containing protein [Synergistaceae bacterium]|nr:transglycosylase SLT domain-containing protein [Synergistaceae bacterium]MBR1603293.1 transglycosylase SLT domain-containing protein [Synergistaceae bacterium]